MDVDETILRRDSETVEAEIPWRIFGFGFLALGGRRRGVIIIIIIISTRPCRPKREGILRLAELRKVRRSVGAWIRFILHQRGKMQCVAGGKAEDRGETRTINGQKNIGKKESHTVDM